MKWHLSENLPIVPQQRPWINSTIHVAMSERDKLHTDFLKEKTPP